MILQRNNGKKVLLRAVMLCKAENYYLRKYVETRKDTYRNLLIKYSEFDIDDIDESISLYFDNANTRRRRKARRRYKTGK